MKAQGLSRLSELRLEDVGQVGGKAANLGELFQKGFKAVDGFIVPPDFDLEANSDEVRAAFRSLNSPTVAVRSSASGEDSSTHSFAGQFDTYLHVDESNLLEKIQACRDSVNNERVQAYMRANGLGSDQVRMTVIVQAMLIPEVTGVAFTKNPLTDDSKELLIEACWGLGEVLVSGQVTPDEYCCSRLGELLQKEVVTQDQESTYQNGKLAMVPVPAKRRDKQKLNDAQLKELVDVLVKLEAGYGYPLDVEWIYSGGQFYIMQARPITT